MGDVYVAHQRRLSREVAVKVLQPGLANPRAFERFRREAETAAALGHPNIVQIIDFRNEPGEPPMLIMEKLDGRPLSALLAEAGTLEPARAVLIALQILSALSAAHRANVVHRDIKPDNVFILQTLAVRDFVKVIDFGIAKATASAKLALTDPRQILGTASYMAPEQARGLPIDGRADLFAVGLILFRAITGQRARELGAAGLYSVAQLPCRKLRDVAPAISGGLASVIDRSLALDPDERFRSAEAMAFALAPFSASREPLSPEDGPTRPSPLTSGLSDPTRADAVDKATRDPDAGGTVRLIPPARAAGAPARLGSAQEVSSEPVPTGTVRMVPYPRQTELRAAAPRGGQLAPASAPEKGRLLLALAFGLIVLAMAIAVSARLVTL